MDSAWSLTDDPERLSRKAPDWFFRAAEGLPYSFDGRLTTNRS